MISCRMMWAEGGRSARRYSQSRRRPRALHPALLRTDSHLVQSVSDYADRPKNHTNINVALLHLDHLAIDFKDDAVNLLAEVVVNENECGLYAQTHIGKASLNISSSVRTSE